MDYKKIAQNLDKLYSEEPELLFKLYNQLRKYFVTNEDFKQFLEQSRIQFENLIQQMNQRFEEINKRFEEVNQRFEGINQRFEKSDERFDNLIQQMNQRFEETNKKIDGNQKVMLDKIDQIRKFEKWNRKIFKLFTRILVSFKNACRLDTSWEVCYYKIVMVSPRLTIFHIKSQKRRP